MTDVEGHYEALTMYGAGRFTGKAGYWARLTTEDKLAPVITLVSPAAGTALSPSDAIVVDVTDDGTLAHVELRAAQLDDIECVHDGTAYTPRYAYSTRVALASGYRYTIRRRDGWIAAPTLTATAIDSQGNAS
jgi:hypothetical protein